MINPTASILINNYNYGHFLKEAINSALNQTQISRDIEVIVVDDGSTDNSHDVINSFDSRIIAIKKRNGGQASAFNAGVSKASGEFIFFLDADDFFFPEKITKILNIFSANPDAQWVFHPLKYYQNATKTYEGESPARRTGVIDDTRFIRKYAKPSIYIPPTSGFCFRRKFLDNIFPIPEEHGIAISDKYLANLSISKGSGYFHPESLSALRIHENNRYSQKTNNEAASNIAICTAYWILKKDKSMKRYCHKLFSRGLALSGNQSKNSTALISAYMDQLSIKEKISIKTLKWIYSIKHLF